ncbi:aldehyde dehydrogenase family protein [Microlunatus antarcticus]|uniref:Acyl-CoA reductase-like NAD-dependent aldehyde dehydrogenase n=1 Tax=Microlunatus antarcticus TaxID=53388 RepID=A0A7W5JWE2_9ACTN|nr:aldehyde dehydrogenase family protein [Microlunatus antarcticus]MBB3327540.1 acyl-CoA reductase-like NAD-dependent aldehyde dehydrogenase [Microlunatus antarcticus]
MTTTEVFLHVDGTDRPGADGASFAVVDPFSGETVATVAEATPGDVDDAVAAARRAYDDQRWRGQAPRDRARVLNRAAGLLAARIDDLAELETRQIGRPLREMRAQLRRLPEWLEYFGAVAQTAEGTVPDFGHGHLNVVRRVPLGVAGLITPWNHPLLITMKKLSVALAAGNSVVLKPSELAPVVPGMLVTLLEEAGVPAGVVDVVHGFGRTTGRALSEHRGLAKVDVTGGTETGRAIAAHAGRSLIPVTAELGGKAPVIVFDDVDLDVAVSGSLFAAFVATGQTCVQGSRLLVAEAVHDRFVAALVARTDALRLGDPMQAGTQVGPLVSEAQRDKTARAVERAVEQGATVLAGGAVPTAPELSRGWFYPPTILGGVTSSMDIWTEEVFGPVTLVRSFTDDADAVRLANDAQFGLAASVWTADTARALRVSQQLEIGIVWVNDHHRIDPSSPWGGFKDSGLGSENGLDAFHAYTRAQSVVVNTQPPGPDWFGTTSDLRYS